MTGMTYEMIHAIRDMRPLVLLAEIEHPSGTGRFWSGVGDLSYNGFTWGGAGILGTITPIKHTTEIIIQEIVFSLSGVPNSAVEKLDEDVRNLSGTVWLAALNEQGGVVPDPLLIVDSQLDYQSLKTTDDMTSTLAITARTGFYSLDRALNDVWSSEDQRLRYPNDSGLDLISSLQNQELIWAPA